METNKLPEKIYKISQSHFSAIPGTPWVYAINPSALYGFENLPFLETEADIVLGMKTSDNFRFVRYWWEIPEGSKNWVLYEKHVSGFGFYYPTHAKVLWTNEAVSYYHDYYSAQLPNAKYWLKPGICFSSISSNKFTTKILLSGRMCDMAANTIFPLKQDINSHLSLLGILNSNLCQYFLNLLNPTVNYQVIDVKRIPISIKTSKLLNESVTTIIRLKKFLCTQNEATSDFLKPFPWNSQDTNELTVKNEIDKFLSIINDEVFQLYNISENDKKNIEQELSGGMSEGEEEASDIEELEETVDSANSKEAMAIKWISFAVGIVLGWFHPGKSSSLGSSIYRKDNFKVGSLPAPSDQEFEKIVGFNNEVAYLDSAENWHMFSEKVEQSLINLTLPNGISVLSEDDPYDLSTRVHKALELMLGSSATSDVLRLGAGGDLRKFLEKDYLTFFHLRAYRKRPIYWYIQSSKRSYGFVIFHEKITKDTLYAIQREPYLDTKRNAVNLEMQDMHARIQQSAGGERKKLEKRLAELHDLADELTQFAKDLEEITRNGYEPEPDWIDDGVILRMAPLWKVIPLWKSEPKKYWDRLEAGDFDWGHIAMKYWPKRVREKCRTNKSFAIAHGHEEWYEGK